MKRTVLLALAVTLTGCYALYEHRIDGNRVSVYGDHDLARLESTARFVERAMEGFRRLFPNGGRDVPPPRVVYEVDELTQNNVYLPYPRQEGYYLPMLRLVHLSPQIVESASDDKGAPLEELEAARVVTLHELSHHFLISVLPESNSKYWLNEGFACVMETAWLGDGDDLIVPYFHPWLHRRARLALTSELGEKRFMAELRSLLDASWMTFHRKGNKTLNYAISYVAVAFLLQNETEGAIEDRLRQILGWSTDELMARLERLPDVVERPPATVLAELAQSPVHRTWALTEWVALGAPDRNRLVRELQNCLDSDLPDQRCLGGELSARVLSRRHARPQAFSGLESQLARRLSSAPHEERIAIAGDLTPLDRGSPCLEPLIELLQSHDEELRIAAAGALTRSGLKPMIARPAFWRNAAESRREAEIAEWRSWLDGVLRTDE